MTSPNAAAVEGAERFDVLCITTGGEHLVAIFDSMDAAFDDCVARWSGRKAGSPVYAVRDALTEQRWSYADIKDLRGVSP